MNLLETWEEAPWSARGVRVECAEAPWRARGVRVHAVEGEDEEEEKKEIFIQSQRKRGGQRARPRCTSVGDEARPWRACSAETRPAQQGGGRA